jgi:hypothetical protein
MFKYVLWKFELQAFLDFKNAKMLSMKYFMCVFFPKCPQVCDWSSVILYSLKIIGFYKLEEGHQLNGCVNLTSKNMFKPV